MGEDFLIGEAVMSESILSCLVTTIHANHETFSHQI